MGQITRHEYATNDEWLALRTSLTGRLGGSELGVAAGHSNYASPYSLFCEKVGMVQPKDISDREAIIQGHDLEQYVADRFTRKTGKKVHQELCIFTNTDAPHLKASIDRKVDDEDSGLECKTVKDIVMRKFPRGDFPQSYYDQCACYLKVTELKRWYLAMLVFGTDFKVFMMTTVREEEERYNALKVKMMGSEPLTDEESKEWTEKYEFLEACYFIDKGELDACEEIAAQFIGRCEAFCNGDGNAWPLEEVDGSASTLGAIISAKPTVAAQSVVTFDSASEYGMKGNGEVFANYKREDIVNLCKKRAEIDAVIDQLTDEKKSIENQMAIVMGEIETFVMPQWKVTYKMTSPRKFASAEKIEEYFQAKKEKVPEGIITMSEPKRSIRFYESKGKGKK